jgi:hypothetical protein
MSDSQDMTGKSVLLVLLAHLSPTLAMHSAQRVAQARIRNTSEKCTNIHVNRAQ